MEPVERGSTRARIVLCLGKSPRRQTLLHSVLERLLTAGVSVEVHLARELGAVEWSRIPARTLIVQRGLDSATLATLEPLEAAGLRLCNGISATIAVSDRVVLSRQLSAASLPVPASTLAPDWRTARSMHGNREVIVKAIDATRGRGTGVAFPAADGWPVDPPFQGPVLIQERIAHDGRDRKVYVVGDQCRGLLKPSVRGTGSVEAFDPPTELRQLAQAVGRVLELDIYGVDFLVSPSGPFIVDVNPFPGLRGVAGASPLVAGHLERLAVELASSSGHGRWRD